MKIAVLQDDLPPHHVGGGGVVAHRLSRELVRRGHTVVAITTVQQREVAGSETVDGMVVHRLYSSYHPRWRAYKSLYNQSVLREVQRILCEFKPDVVHVHNVHSHLSYYSLVYARRYGRAVVMTEHDSMSFHFGKLVSMTDPALQELPESSYREPLLQQLRMHRWRFNPLRSVFVCRVIRKSVDATVAVSDALKRALEYNAIPVRAVIHNGIDVSQWGRPDSIMEFKRTHGLMDKVVCFGGRLSEPKGGLQAVKALSIVRRSIPDAQLLVAGKRDTFAERMSVYAQQLGVGDALVFAGWLSGSDLVAAYHGSKVVIVPSVYLDPFPTVNLEAFASKKPVVASCFGGSKEVVEDGVSGYTVNPLDVEMFASKLSELLLDSGKAEQFGLAGYERVVREFTLDKQANEYEKLFAELL